MENKQYIFDDSLARIDLFRKQEIPQEPIPLQELLATEPKRMARAFASVVSVKFKLPNDQGREDNIRYKAALFSELTYLLFSDPGCIHVFYEENIVNAVLNTPKKADIDIVLETVAKLNVFQNVFNVKYEIAESDKISFGIGMVYGDVWYIPTLINENVNLIFEGKAISLAKELADKGLEFEENIVASFSIHNNLKDDYKKFFNAKKLSTGEDVFTCSVINTYMNKWVTENKK